MEKENFLNNQEIKAESKESLIEKNSELRNEVITILNEVGSFDGVATTVTPEIHKDFDELNLSELLGKIDRAETALGIKSVA